MRFDGVLADPDLDPFAGSRLVAQRDLSGVALAVSRRSVLLRLALAGRRPGKRKRREGARDEEACEEGDRLHVGDVGSKRSGPHPSNEKGRRAWEPAALPVH